MKKKISRQKAINAVETLLQYIGEDPSRDGLKDTPKRVVEAFGEWFRGYNEDPIKELSRVFEDTGGYQDMVILRDIKFFSHCEHHIAPIVGTAHVAYYPTKRVVGISKLARVVEIYAKRLQTQEYMTHQIGHTIEQTLDTNGVAVIIEAEHFCMSTRGVLKPGVCTITRYFSGKFSEIANQQAFEQMIKS